MVWLGCYMPIYAYTWAGILDLKPTTNQMASLDHTLCLPLLFILIISTVHVLPASATRSHKLKNAITIREVNRRGPYIGLVTVFETEENAFLGSVDFRPDPAHPFLDLSGIYIIIYIYMLFLITATSWIDIFYMLSLFLPANGSKSLWDV